MVVALGVLAVTSLLIAAVYVAVTVTCRRPSATLNGQRAYYAARAGENAFLYQLNQNPNFWTHLLERLPADGDDGSRVDHRREVLVRSGLQPRLQQRELHSANAIAALIDTNTGTSAHGVHRLLRTHRTLRARPASNATIVTSFRKPSPLDYPLVHRSRDGGPGS